jgi:hypothetical protein
MISTPEEGAPRPARLHNHDDLAPIYSMRQSSAPPLRRRLPSLLLLLLAEPSSSLLATPSTLAVARTSAAACCASSAAVESATWEEEVRWLGRQSSWPEQQQQQQQQQHAGARFRRRVAASPACVLADSSYEPRTVDPDSSLAKAAEDAASIRCPFWRTRAYDALESALSVANFVAARHKSFLDRPWLPGSEASLFEPLALPARKMGEKRLGLSVEEVMDVVRADMEERSYYVTGRLTSAIYSDDCFFDSPDPDMPVKSLARYSDALHGLFDPSLSAIELLGLEKVCERSFVAHWRLSGALKLPWRPQIKPYLGATRYELDEAGLIVSHNEQWSVSALEAFVSTLFPELFGGLGGPPAPEAGVLQRDESLWRAIEAPPSRVVVAADTASDE